jgi:hypothetical protein
VHSPSKCFHQARLDRFIHTELQTPEDFPSFQTSRRLVPTLSSFLEDINTICCLSSNHLVCVIENSHLESTLKADPYQVRGHPSNQEGSVFDLRNTKYVDRSCHPSNWAKGLIYFIAPPSPPLETCASSINTGSYAATGSGDTSDNIALRSTGLVKRVA